MRSMAKAGMTTLPPAGRGLVHDVGELVHRVLGRLVEPVAVGRLEDEVVHRGDHRGVADDRLALSARGRP